MDGACGNGEFASLFAGAPAFGVLPRRSISDTGVGASDAAALNLAKAQRGGSLSASEAHAIARAVLQGERGWVGPTCDSSECFLCGNINAFDQSWPHASAKKRCLAHPQANCNTQVLPRPASTPMLPILTSEAGSSGENNDISKPELETMCVPAVTAEISALCANHTRRVRSFGASSRPRSATCVELDPHSAEHGASQGPLSYAQRLLLGIPEHAAEQQSVPTHAHRSFETLKRSSHGSQCDLISRDADVKSIARRVSRSSRARSSLSSEDSRRPPSRSFTSSDGQLCNGVSTGVSGGSFGHAAAMAVSGSGAGSGADRVSELGGTPSQPASQRPSLGEAEGALQRSQRSRRARSHGRAPRRLAPEWDFEVQDLVCALEFHAEGDLLLSVGVNKQLRLYSMRESAHIDAEIDSYAAKYTSAPLKVHRMPAKLASATWCPWMDCVATTSDYDGVITQVALPSGHIVTELDEHGGRNVWSIRHSPLRRGLTASGGDDGVVRLWGGANLEHVVGSLPCALTSPSVPGVSASSVCCVDWSSSSCDLLTAALSDGSCVLCDVRQYSRPLARWQAHSRATSYVKFFGSSHVVSASIDGTLQLWRLQDAQAGLHAELQPAHARTFSGHVNQKNFVGMAVLPEEGLVATGSEDGVAYVYQQSWDVPMLRHALDASLWGAIVTAVAWQPLAASQARGLGPTMASATSDGLVHVVSLCQ